MKKSKVSRNTHDRAAAIGIGAREMDRLAAAMSPPKAKPQKKPAPKAGLLGKIQ